MDTGFRKRSCSKNKLERDDDSKKSHPALGEAAGKVSAATQAAHPEIPWREITAMRHRLIHGYGEVRLDLVWMVVRDRLGPVITKLVGLVPGESEEER